MNSSANTYKILGITDDQTTCDCCGKTNLKRVVALEIEGQVVKFGTTCAARALIARGSDVTTASLTVEVEAVAYAQKWLDAGRSAESVAAGVWKKFGFSATAKNGAVQIYPFAEVRKSI